MEPAELIDLVSSVSSVWKSLGKSEFTRSKSELSSKVFRRSLYFVMDLLKGEIIKPEHVRRIRPGYGLPPKFLNEIIGRKLKVSVERGDCVTWNVLE